LSDGGRPPAWIETVDEAAAEGRLAELYARVADPESGRVDHVLKVHSLHPEGLAAHFAVYRAAMRPTRTLSQVDRELIAVVVSARNGCHY
jgi:alkylhydroperoxidase family enzyme